MSGIENLAEGAGKLLGAVPELYDDLAKPAVQEAGEMLAFPIELVNALLYRPRCWIANAKYNLDETNLLIANKLKYIEENKLIAPPDHVAVPALQALAYSMDSSELRNLYANLLANAMNLDKQANVHPAYIEIIKQFSPLDAQVFKHIVMKLSNDNDIYFAHIHIISNEKIIRKYENVVIGFEEAELSRITESVDNLIRCGLIAFTDNTLVDVTDDDAANIVQMKNVKSEISQDSSANVSWITPAHITELGKRFYSICCENQSPEQT